MHTRDVAGPAARLAPAPLIEEPAPGWAWCLADYARERNVALDPDVLVLLGAALWLGLVRDDTPDARLTAKAFRDSTAYVSGSRPNAVETATATLGGELVIFRQRDVAQFRWLRQRALRRQRTLVTVGTRLFDSTAAAGRTTVALIEDIESPATPMDADSTANTRVLVRAGANTIRRVGADEFLASWVSATLSSLDSEWLVWVPAVPRDEPNAWRALASVSLARQYLALTASSEALPAGAALLHGLRLELAADSRHDRVRAHLALIARSSSRVAELGGPGPTRSAAARGVARLAVHCALAEPEAAAMRLLEFALEEAACDWRRLATLPRATTAVELDAAYAAVEARETRLADALEHAAAAMDRSC